MSYWLFFTGLRRTIFVSSCCEMTSRYWQHLHSSLFPTQSNYEVFFKFRCPFKNPAKILRYLVQPKEVFRSLSIDLPKHQAWLPMPWQLHHSHDRFESNCFFRTCYMVISCQGLRWILSPQQVSPPLSKSE